METADAALGGRLKSGKGEARWARFFVLMSTAMAWMEDRPRVPAAPRTDIALRSELRSLTEELDVTNRLRSFQRSIQVVGQVKIERSQSVVLVLDPLNNTITLTAFPASQAESAASFYDDQEAKKPAGGDVVLVRAADADAVRRGYPSFYRDAETFLECLQEAIL